MCPICKVGSDKFEEIQSEMQLADEHRIGIAYEEAEHSEKFAEILGEVVMPDTKSNISVRVEAEFGACSVKKDLARLAKKHNLDAIHGRVFKGLLDRYFSK